MALYKLTHKGEEIARYIDILHKIAEDRMVSDEELETLFGLDSSQRATVIATLAKLGVIQHV